MKLELPKGMKDSLPEEKIRKDALMDSLKEVFERFGYNPLDTPVVERFSVLSSKYAGGAEILKETFKLKDQGERELGLRYDLTVPFARVVGMNPSLKKPFKRYQMDKVWRDGPVGMGRYREFWQCDVDMVGSSSMMADAEMMAVARDVLQKLGFDYNIELNNRRLLNGILDYAGVKEDKENIILIIDKIKKVSREDLKKELNDNGLSDEQIDKIFDVFDIKGDSSEKLEKLKGMITSEEGKQGIAELEDLFGYLEAYGIGSYTLELSLSRGLAFYTGTVYEAFLKGSKIRSAVASGGRYDDIIGKFLDSNESYPAVGISFGLSRLYDAVSQEETKKTVTDVFVLPIKTQKESVPIVDSLRKQGVNAEIDLVGRGISKNLNYANSLGIPYVVFVGEEELKSEKYKLRDMSTGKEEYLSLGDIVKRVKK